MTLEQRIDQVLATSQPNPSLCQEVLRDAKIELASLRQQLNLAQRRIFYVKEGEVPARCGTIPSRRSVEL